MQIIKTLTTTINIVQSKLQRHRMILYVVFVAFLAFTQTAIFAQNNANQQAPSMEESTQIPVYAPSGTSGVNSPATGEKSNLQNLTSPDQADAQIFQTLTRTVSSMYSFFCSVGSLNGAGECEITRPMWAASLLVKDLLIDMAFVSICSKTGEEVVSDRACGNAALTAQLLENPQALRGTPENPYVRFEGDGAFFIASNFHSVANEPPIPTDLALFIDDTFQDTIMPGSSAYAQGIFVEPYRAFVIRGWRLSRNIALSLLGAFVGIAALMVMFRTQIAPKVAVSVYSVLPMIPISLGLILLSYPILSLIYGFIPPFVGFVMAFSSTIIVEVFSISGGVANLASLAFTGLILSAASGGTFTLIIAILAALGVGILFILGLTILWQLCKIFASLIFYTFAAPFVFLMAVIPGKSGLIMNFFKKIAVDVFTVPAIILMATLGFAIIAYGPDSADIFSWNIGASFAAVGFTFFASFIKLFIGMGILWNAKNARGSIERLMGAGNLWGMDPPKR